jgi:D-alanine-D-alanine ligase-like ATP-grasp enzyme
LYIEAKKFPNVVVSYTSFFRGLTGSDTITIQGCDSVFINNTLTKNGMKKIFRDNMVSTPPGFAVTKETDLEAEVTNWGMTYPLFVKISDSYGSVGIDESSVCFDLEGLKRKVESLFESFQNLTVEEFIEGPEFSVRALKRNAGFVLIHVLQYHDRFLSPEIVVTRIKPL